MQFCSEEVKKWLRNNMPPTEEVVRNNCPDPMAYISYFKMQVANCFNAHMVVPLSKSYSLHLSTIHQVPLNFKYEHQRVLHNLYADDRSRELISNELRHFEENFYPLTITDKHIAWKIIAMDYDAPIVFRISNKEWDDEPNIVDIPEELFKYFVRSFEICHVRETIKNIYESEGFNKHREHLDTFCRKLKSVEDPSGKRLFDSSEDKNIVESFIISFYVILTVLKLQKYPSKQYYDRNRCLIFKGNEELSALFVPIGGEVNKTAALASLHTRLLDGDNCKMIGSCYKNFLEIFLEWERLVEKHLHWIDKDKLLILQEIQQRIPPDVSLILDDKTDYYKTRIEEARLYIKKLESLLKQDIQ